MKRALISVSDKKGIVPFAKELVNLGYEIISTGGTYKLLQSEGIQVTGIHEVTGFPEILDGRVKTLHPNIHSGLLAMLDKEEHRKQLKELNIQPIDLVVVNLYPFKETIQKSDVTFDEAIENIDIGGPTMLRSAAKNHRFVTVVVDSNDYERIITQLKEKGQIDEMTRRKLAAKVFRHTASYDAMIAGYLNEQLDVKFPNTLTITFEKVQDLRYGENPHQQAAFYREALLQKGNISSAQKLHGKELSYNNINDADAAIQIVKEFTEPAVVAIKHTNPCGVGVGNTIFEAYRKAYESDPISIFGGIVAANRPIDGDTAMQLKEIFLEIIMAPSFTEEALNILTTKKNLRLLALGDQLQQGASPSLRYHSVGGGLLVQEEDVKEIDEENLTCVTERKPTPEELKQLLFAWKVVKHVKSNAIVLAKNDQTIGVGAGQMNRVGSARIAIEQAGEKAKGSVMASDAFFPMPDTVEEAGKAGITAIIQPGGSIKDEDSIKEANKHGIAMIFTGQRHFKH
ncbi:bifunctional phosphoribosylaminoimidazolecarboxamide formyltransferase/IMP cyclohydrolase [Microaerobacter geothermalis]|uniref:bifunctional phosphoribosylaminoimidazolecarboxamide formyltransferase/IMP cyclohydrolase n=1 Tax=Microaerobacter geothermalis TaxID=674972 RepID=UPI001F4117BA|nr:bifunctional phosphoribosylaminoimidazolecarboxamide formyltransferase/IMP cyclohydrolase [Microaerobacter geothermalis]MCF6094483.1 bifunctional phosphoribosylaminoimidazolecarboxamide formyltransferase/IMP cyclohydrolase [Microaerobacter geothermalis]